MTIDQINIRLKFPLLMEWEKIALNKKKKYLKDKAYRDRAKKIDVSLETKLRFYEIMGA